MKNHLKIIILLTILILILLSGCNETTKDVNNNKNDCLTPEEIDKLELDFYQMRNELAAYLNDTEFKFSNQSNTSQQGVLTDEGRQKRLEYEELRETYIEKGFKKCEKTDGSILEYGNVSLLKGFDLIDNKIHPEKFLGLPIYSKLRWLYEEPDQLSGETTDLVEYVYFDKINNQSVNAVIRAWHVGTDMDQWQWLAKEQNFKNVSFNLKEPVGSNIYYTDDYEDDYGWKYKGIYFQIFGFKVYAGYYSYSENLGTDPNYFRNIEFNEDDAKNIYLYLVFSPG
jgi:hypothetical protein